MGREGSLLARATRRIAWARARADTAPSAARQILADARSFRAERLVAVLEHPLAWQIALKVAAEMAVPTTVIVEDPPEYLLRVTGADGVTQRHLSQALNALMGLASKVGVASPRMGQVFRERYAVDPVWLVHGFERDRWLAPRGALQADGLLTIAFAGSMYATDAWEAFLKALAHCEWQVGKRRVCFRLVGGMAPGPIKHGAHYDVYSWRSQMETTRLIGTADVAYVPYWLDPRQSDVTRLSFPSKLSLYVAAGTPVFFHGPADACAAEFVREHSFGVTCASHDPLAIVASLETLVNPATYQHVSQRIPMVRERYLGAHVFRRRFAELVGFDEAILAAPIGPLCDCGYE
jgi:hypothetical protein